MLKTNFLGIQSYGAPTGVDQKPSFFSGGFCISPSFKNGRQRFPAKYERIYYHWVTDELSYMSDSESDTEETVADYFAYNFGHDVIYAYLLLEGNQSAIGKLYYQGYLDSEYHNVMDERDAYFNAIYLDLTGQPMQYPNIEHDIEDQLMRMDINHFPD